MSYLNQMPGDAQAHLQTLQKKYRHFLQTVIKLKRGPFSSYS